MTLKTDQYSIDGDRITISRDELLRWRDTLLTILDSVESDRLQVYYSGRADTIGDILNAFEKDTSS